MIECTTVPCTASMTNDSSHSLTPQLDSFHHHSCNVSLHEPIIRTNHRASVPPRPPKRRSMYSRSRMNTQIPHGIYTLPMSNTIYEEVIEFIVLNCTLYFPPWVNTNATLLRCFAQYVMKEAKNTMIQDISSGEGFHDMNSLELLHANVLKHFMETCERIMRQCSDVFYTQLESHKTQLDCIRGETVPESTTCGICCVHKSDSGVWVKTKCCKQNLHRDCHISGLINHSRQQCIFCRHSL